MNTNEEYFKAKFDEGKLRYDLVPVEWEEAIAEVLTYGAKVHGDESWRTVPEGKKRYYAALRRHLAKYRKGQNIDDESNLSHLAHVAVNALFIMSLENKNRSSEDATKN